MSGARLSCLLLLAGVAPRNSVALKRRAGDTGPASRPATDRSGKKNWPNQGI